ncbi:hypothetical protein ECC02_001636 [Trypanosoma cruzi]|uniref:Uncharacterized protein n=1 Tax=Trypanosoma cruzi TaxID=5693 RepID=A0A7J6YEA0_TRYCR|nr:hypothetical protein ECC02_001636 [Trypanosoma cruzi]
MRHPRRHNMSPRLFLFLEQLLVLLFFCQLGTAEQLPECRDLGLFRPPAHDANSPTATPLEVVGGDANVTCLLRPGAEVATLLGSPEGLLLSPLRDRVRLAGSHVEPAAKKLKKNRVASFLLRAKLFLYRFSAYPWGDPAAVERFFFQRRLRITFDVENLPGGMESRSQLLSRAVFDHLLATSFAPTAELVEGKGNASNKDVRLTCNLGEMLAAYRKASNDVSFISRMMGNIGLGALLSLFFGYGGYGATVRSAAAGGDVSPMFLETAEGGLVYVFEELGPNGRSSLWLPSWVAAWLGTRPMASTETLFLGKDGQHRFVYEAQLPAANPVCLRLAVAHAKELVIHVEDFLLFDFFWLKIILVLCLIRFLQPWIEDVPAFQILLAGMGGTIVLVGFVLLFLFRKLQNMTLGKIGLFALLTVGGFSVLAESLLSAYAAFLYAYFNYYEESDLIFCLKCVLLLVGIACGFFAKFFWASYLFSLTRWTLRWAQLGTVACAMMQNREATIVFLATAYVFYPSRLLRFILWCSRSQELENRENEPKEKFPGSARREVAYVQPLCVEGFIGGSRALSSEEKLRLYDALGNEYTQRALAHLADSVKEDPRRYASRLKNPSDVVKWARQYN